MFLEKTFTEGGFKDGGISILENIKALLLRFINESLPIAPAQMDLIRTEAIKTFTLGFATFHRQPTQQIDFIRDLFSKTSDKASGLAALQVPPLPTLSSCVLIFTSPTLTFAQPPKRAKHSFCSARQFLIMTLG